MTTIPPSRLRPLLPVVLLSTFACCLLLARVIITSRLHYAFLGWNLLLAWVPLGFAFLAESLRRDGRSRGWQLAIPLGLWLLFLPNAPYLITDLIHVRPPHNAVYWCDLAMVFTFAFAGIAAGLVSMRMVCATLASLYGHWVAHGVILLSAVLCGVGIYLGRVLRWNSWDLLTQPHELLPQIGRAVLDPWQHRYPAAMSLLFGMLFAVMYIASELAAPRLRRDMMIR